MSRAKSYLHKIKAMLAKDAPTPNGITALKKEVLLQALALKTAHNKAALSHSIDLAESLIKLIRALEAPKCQK